MKVRYRVLVVDDEESTLELLREELEEQGLSVYVWHVREFPDASELLFMRFDAFLIDVMLPGGNGFELAREIRSRLGDNAAIFLMSQAPEDFLEQAESLSLPLKLKASLLKESGIKSLASEFLATVPLRCLVCDDSLESAEVVEEFLADIGLNVELVVSVAKAIEVVAEKDFHLAFVDIFWKLEYGLEPSGLEVLRNIKEEDNRTFVVAFSQYEQAFVGSVGEEVAQFADAVVGKEGVVGPRIHDLLREMWPALEEISNAQSVSC